MQRSKSLVFHVTDITGPEPFLNTPQGESFSELNTNERKIFFSRREDDEVSGWQWIVVHPVKCVPVYDRTIYIDEK
jgi:hypothetical protein